MNMSSVTQISSAHARRTAKVCDGSTGPSSVTRNTTSSYSSASPAMLVAGMAATNIAAMNNTTNRVIEFPPPLLPIRHTDGPMASGWPGTAVSGTAGAGVPPG